MNKKIQVTPVILCGGAGTRLWPLSRTGFPKQFLCLMGQHTLFQQSAIRFAELENKQITLLPQIFVAGEEHRFLIAEQLREVGIDRYQLILEPIGRNTAPALTLAALEAQCTGEDSVLVVTPADQTIEGNEALNNTISAAIQEAEKGSVVILGIKPEKPETGFGYIKTGCSEAEILEVTQFTEKPDAKTAESFLKESGYFWNAGIFVLKSSIWLDMMEKYQPNILNATRNAWEGRKKDSKFVKLDLRMFEAIPPESIDYAVMEPATRTGEPIKMVPLNARWSDLGSWEALWKAREKDSKGNVLIGDILSLNAKNSYVHATSRIVALAGVKDLIVIETPDAILVASNSNSQDVKELVEILKKNGRPEHAMHRKVNRPWGWFDSVEEGNRFKVKRINVKPGESLSLQKHYHRAEHWIVVSGTAEITNGKETKIYTENESTYISVGALHMLKNPGKVPLEIIEVQTGSYLGEDDIVRISDIYQRN